MAFLTQIKSQQSLNLVPASQISDRSNANTNLSGKDVLDDEAERWKYFFDSGVNAWFDDLKEVTFTSTFCELTSDEAKIIVTHWEERRAMVADFTSKGISLSNKEADTTINNLVNVAASKLTDLVIKLDSAIAIEKNISPINLAFVKLSTRSPKDSKKALHRAKIAYYKKINELGGNSKVNANQRWRILCEETTRSGAVDSGTAALELLLDSDRVYEDLEYALRGPPESWTSSKETNESHALNESKEETATCIPSHLSNEKLAWNMSLVARAWDPRLKPESEFRGLVWNNKLTCLCQYFHPLLFPELAMLRQQILADIQMTFNTPKVLSAVQRLGGHCIVDFAWLEPGNVIIVELNPFDGVCLGTFPASTGLFLWDKPEDQLIMKGISSFEFRLRETELAANELKNQCNSEWRDIIYGDVVVENEKM